MRSHVRIVLKSGATIEFEAADAQVEKGWRGTLRKLDWTRPDDWSQDLLYLKRDEVAAVVVTRLSTEVQSDQPSEPPDSSYPIG